MSYPIIDAHTHIEGLPGCPWLDPPELIIGLLDEAKIAKAIVMTYCDAPFEHDFYDPLIYIRDAVQHYPDRLIGFARLNPEAEGVEKLLQTAILDWGFKGLKLHPFGYCLPPDGEETVCLVRQAAQLGVPTLFHCGDEDYTLPLELERLAKACPEAQLIFGHMGGYFHVMDAIAVAKRCPNVYLETSATPHPGLILKAIRELGAERIIFASDGPGCDPSIEVAKLEILELNEQQNRQIFSENICRLLPNL